MDTATREAASSKTKKTWERPFLMRLEVGETAAKARGCHNDHIYPNTDACS